MKRTKVIFIKDFITRGELRAKEGDIGALVDKYTSKHKIRATVLLKDGWLVDCSMSSLEEIK